MINIKELPKNTISDEEVRVIIKDFQENGQTFENEKRIADFLGQYLGLVHYGAHRYYPTYANNPEYAEDMEAAGLRGLVTAMKTFDCERENLFQTWAYRFILNEMRDYISTEIMGISVYFHKNLKKVKLAIKEFELAGETYTDEDIIMRCESMGVSEKSVLDCLCYLVAKTPYSIDSFNSDDDDSVSLVDALSSEAEDFQNPSEIYEKTEERKTLYDKMHGILDDKEFDIVMRYYVETEKPAKIAEVYNTDELTITRIISAATTKIELAFADMKKSSNTDDVSDIAFSSFLFGAANDEEEIELGSINFD